MREIIAIVTGAVTTIAATITGTGDSANPEFDPATIRARTCGYAAYATLTPVAVFEPEETESTPDATPDATEPVQPTKPTGSDFASPLAELMASAKPQPKPADELATERIIEIYAANKAAIDEIWIADEGRTLKEAVEIWLIESESKPSKPETPAKPAKPVDWSWIRPASGNYEPRLDPASGRVWYKRVEPKSTTIRYYQWRSQGSCSNGRCR